MQTWRHTREEYAIGKESFRKQRKKKKYENQTIEQQSKQAANKRKKNYITIFYVYLSL